MKELLDTIRHYGPRIVRTLVGAMESEVSALETAHGAPLPLAYREFVLAAGRSLGLFHPFDDRYDFSIDAVRAAVAEWSSPRYLCIARDDSGLDLNLYLDLASGSDDPPVVALLRSGRGEPDPKSESFRRFWLTAAFTTLRMPLLVWQNTFVAGDDPTLLPQLEALAAELRMPRVDGTGGFHPCYDRGDIALEAYQPPGLGLAVHAAAADKPWLDALQPILERRLGLMRID
jgi:hypothetical protein